MSYEEHHILIVDDDSDQVELVTHVLLKQDPPPKITVVTSGPACIDSLTQESFSAVLLDFSLPGMDGMKVFDEIQQREIDVPVIMVTGRGDETVAVEAMKRGVSDYVVKKTGYEKLLPTVVAKSAERHSLKILLEESEQRYRKLVECASDVVCMVNTEGKILMINPHVKALTGLEPHEVQGQAIFRLIVSQDLPEFEKAFEEVCGGGTIRSEFRVSHTAEQSRWVSAGAGPLYERNRVSGGIFILRDVTERKKSELALKRKNEELKLLLNIANTLATNRGLDQTLSIFSEKFVKEIVTTYSRIFLLEEGTLTVRAAFPIQELDWQSGIGEAFSLSSLSIVEDVLSQRRSLVLPPEALAQAIANPEQRKFLVSDLEGIQSALIIPLLFHDHLRGMIVLGERRNWERTPITPELVVLCEAVANQAAIAVENQRLFEALKRANFDTIKALGGALETKDLATKGHSDRTVSLALKVGRKMGLTQQELEWVQYTAILHDIGKIGIPESILNKPAKLTNEEYEIMKKHPVLGSEIISQIEFLKPIIPFVRADHERWDGRGYPDGLSGEEIPVIASIVAAVDAYDAMTADRIYRKAPGKAFAISELKTHSGTQFDPKVVEALLSVLQEEESESKEARRVLKPR